MNNKTIAVIVLLTLAILSFPCMAASDESEMLLRVQQAIVIGDAGWTAGITSMSGLTDAERGGMALGDVVPPPRGAIVTAPTMRSLRYEEKYDCRDIGIVTPVRSQGRCGSCWAFSATGVIESAFLKHANKELDLSEQHLVSSCCDAGDCGGGWPDWAFDYVMIAGVPDENCYPYEDQDTACNPCVGWADRAYKISDYVYVEHSTADFKWALKEYGPVSVVLTVPYDWYYYRTGVYTPTQPRNDGVGWANHAVLLTGWDDSDGCWFIKNSWGAGWGEQGYARVKYGILEKYHYAYAITGIVDHGSAPDPSGWVKPVSAIATSEYSDNYHAPRAIDNLTNTHWFSEYQTENPAITFDLGTLQTINAARAMIHYRDVPMLVSLEASGDGANWRTVAENVMINIGSEYAEIPFADTRCQYVRMTQTKTHRGYGMCTEFDVCVVADVAPEPQQSMILIEYPDRTETINISEDVISIMLMRNGTHVWKWWCT